MSWEHFHNAVLENLGGYKGGVQCNRFTFDHLWKLCGLWYQGLNPTEAAIRMVEV